MMNAMAAPMAKSGSIPGSGTGTVSICGTAEAVKDALKKTTTVITTLEQKRINFIISLLVCLLLSMHSSYHSFYVYKKYTVYLLVKNKQIKIVKNVDDKIVFFEKTQFLEEKKTES